MSNNLQAWLTQGEQLYTAALAEFHALESQLEELEQKLAAKQAEVNQIASIINKQPVVQRRQTVVEAEVIDDVPPTHRLPVPAATPPVTQQTRTANANIASALTGKFGR